MIHLLEVAEKVRIHEFKSPLIYNDNLDVSGYGIDESPKPYRRGQHRGPPSAEAGLERRKDGSGEGGIPKSPKELLGRREGLLVGRTGL